MVEGTVKNVTDFGAFIDLGGADGLLHISEMSWGRVENPKKVFKVGEKLKVLIKEIAGNKIALSLVQINFCKVVHRFFKPFVIISHGKYLPSY